MYLGKTNVPGKTKVPGQNFTEGKAVHYLCNVQNLSFIIKIFKK